MLVFISVSWWYLYPCLCSWATFFHARAKAHNFVLSKILEVRDDAHDHAGVQDHDNVHVNAHAHIYSIIYAHFHAHSQSL